VLAAELLSQTERVMLAKRLAVVVMLTRGYSFSQIETMLSVTPQTVSRIFRELKKGNYRKISRYARDRTRHFKETGFWDEIERMLRLGMPPRIGPRRFAQFRRLSDT
jgi:transposase